MIQKISHNNKGYTLLFAVLVSSLVLAVGISILEVSKKEFLLAAAARESTSAFYSADSGLECAAFYDDSGILFRITGGSSVFANSMKCSNHIPTNSSLTSSGGASVYAFDILLDDVGNGAYTCARVTVTKDPKKTTIESRGYNIGWDTSTNTCSKPSPRRVERAIVYDYEY